MMGFQTAQAHGLMLLSVELQSRVRVEPSATLSVKTQFLEKLRATANGFPSANVAGNTP
jgi:hypothetical protein